MPKYSIFLIVTLLSFLLPAQENQVILSGPVDSSVTQAIPWYSYTSSDNSAHIVKFYTDGFRVSLGMVDLESDALMIKRELAYKLGIDLLYIYKEKDKYLLRLGDFVDNGSARQMMFQLMQLGYTKARVVEDKVYSF